MDASIRALAEISLLVIAQEPSSRGSGTSSSTALQIITGVGLGTLLGSVIAALVTQFATSRREQRAHAAKVRGIARVLSEEFFRQQSTLARAIFRQHWWRIEELLHSQVSVDELRELATELDNKRWAAVAGVMGWMAYFKGVQAAAIRTGAPPSAQQLKRFVALYRALDIARYGLSAISGRGYRSHNPEPMRRDVIEELTARPKTGTIKTPQLRSLSEAEAEQGLEDLERDAAKLG